MVLYYEMAKKVKKMLTQSTVTMKPGNDCWDRVSASMRDESNIMNFINFHDRDSVLDTYRQLYISMFDEHSGNLSIEVDGRHYDLSEEQWQSLFAALDQWYEEYELIRQHDEQNNLH